MKVSKSVVFLIVLVNIALLAAMLLTTPVGQPVRAVSPLDTPTSRPTLPPPPSDTPTVTPTSDVIVTTPIAFGTCDPQNCFDTTPTFTPTPFKNYLPLIKNECALCTATPTPRPTPSPIP